MDTVHRWDELWRHVTLATLRHSDAPYGLVRDAAIAFAAGRIAWLGSEAELEREADRSAASQLDLAGALVTPGLIDCHTHLVHAGSRTAELEARLRGDSYAAIAARGGGILSTVRLTRAASLDELVEQSAPRLRALTREGVTTVEIKSGYGLTLESERRMLLAARALGARCEVDVSTTFLGAHAVPPEFAGRADDYVEDLCVRQLPAIAAEGLASCVDAYCESVAFTPAQIARLFKAARSLGLARRLHADQLGEGSGGKLAAAYGALSADHLEHASDESIAAMARAGTVGVLLPVAFYFMRDRTLPPIAKLRSAGVPLAVASDCNPGTAPAASILWAMNMACVTFGLSPEEAFAGATRHAAAALGMTHDRGTLEVGKRADVLAWDVEDPARVVLEPGLHLPVLRRYAPAQSRVAT